MHEAKIRQKDGFVMKNRKTAAILGTIMITAGLLAGCTKEKAEADVQPEESQEEAVQDTSEKTQTGNVTVVEAALEEGSKPLSLIMFTARS